jgi:hypothetical protein
MATYSKKMMGKEVGDGAVYAPPHTMTGKAVKASTTPGSGPNRSSANTVDMAVGNIYRDPEGKPTKTSGIKMRGTGAATKGTMSRGPMG